MPVVIEEKDGSLIVGGTALDLPAAVYAAICIQSAARRCNPGKRVKLAKHRVGGGEVCPAAALRLAGELFSRACCILANKLDASSEANAVPADIGGEAGGA